MVTYLLVGASYAFAAAVQPGPLQTYLLSQAVARGWRATLPAAAAPVISDGPIIVLVLFVLSHLPDRLEHGLRCAGGVFLLYLARGAFTTWRRYRAPDPGAPRLAQRSLWQATIVNLLNPNPYLSWSLVLGPLLLEGWRQSPANGVALLAGFYATMTLSLAGLVALFASAGSLGPRVGRGLVGASATALACLGGYQLWAGVRALVAG